jgi:hypothetical protein
MAWRIAPVCGLGDVRRLSKPVGPNASTGSMAFFCRAGYSLQLETEPYQEVVCDRNRNESYDGMEAK